MEIRNFFSCLRNTFKTPLSQFFRNGILYSTHSLIYAYNSRINARYFLPVGLNINENLGLVLNHFKCHTPCSKY